MKFPTMIAWMEEKGFEELHKEYNEWRAVPENGKEDFETFVQEQYTLEQADYNSQFGLRRDLKVDYDFDGDVEVATAQIILVELIRRGIEDGEVRNIINQEELVPDYQCVEGVMEAFWTEVIPAIEKALNNMASKE